MLNNVSFVTLGKDQFKVKVNVEDEKHIYIIPDKHSYHDLSSLEMCWAQSGNKILLKKPVFVTFFMTLGKGQYKVKVKIKGEKPIYTIYLIPTKHLSNV